ncbi:hypothetical protein R1sor_020012 [Riccia sorocarpa]|uniref:Uncharacterized protein n=1 Tax=Riccia sorocarpa TaxID=122646 RepID=A0ABD3IHY5_9MARC
MTSGGEPLYSLLYDQWKAHHQVSGSGGSIGSSTRSGGSAQSLSSAMAAQRQSPLTSFGINQGSQYSTYSGNAATISSPKTRAGTGKVSRGGLGGENPYEDDSDDDFIPVKSTGGKSAKELVATPPETKATVSNVYEVLAITEEEEEVHTQPLQSTNEGDKEIEDEPEKLPEDIETTQKESGSGFHNGGEASDNPGEADINRVHDLQETQDGDVLMHTEEVGESSDVHKHLSDRHNSSGVEPEANFPTITSWADQVEAEMIEAGSRGVKGRLEFDKSHTPDRGNDPKKRPGLVPGYRKVDSFQELGVGGQQKGMSMSVLLKSTMRDCEGKGSHLITPLSVVDGHFFCPQEIDAREIIQLTRAQ